MKLHRFFIDRDSAFSYAKQRFGGNVSVLQNNDNTPVSQDSGHRSTFRGTYSAVSQTPLYESGSTISIPSEALQHQIAHVFRLDRGDSVILTDGIGFDYVAHIVSIGSEGVTFHVDEVVPQPFAPRFEVTLFAGISKGDIFEWITEKATELGVARIVPVITERTEKKEVRLERLQKIACEAAEQSGRAVVPSVDVATYLSDVYAECLHANAFDRVIVLDPSASVSLRELMQGELTAGGSSKITEGASYDGGGNIVESKVKRIALLIGPEGGWSPAEVASLSDTKYNRVSLGTTILRTETACCAGLALLLL